MQNKNKNERDVSYFNSNLKNATIRVKDFEKNKAYNIQHTYTIYTYIP